MCQSACGVGLGIRTLGMRTCDGERAKNGCAPQPLLNRPAPQVPPHAPFQDAVTISALNCVRDDIVAAGANVPGAHDGFEDGDGIEQHDADQRDDCDRGKQQRRVHAAD